MTNTQLQAMTKPALFAFAAEEGIKVLKKMNKATLIATIEASLVARTAEAPAEAPATVVVPEEEVVVLGSIAGGVDYSSIEEVEAAELKLTYAKLPKEEESSMKRVSKKASKAKASVKPVDQLALAKKAEAVQPVPVGTYVRWAARNVFFKVSRYGYKGDVYVAELVSKAKPTDKELTYHYTPASMIGTDKASVFVPATRQEVYLAFNPKQARKQTSVVREESKPAQRRFVVNVDENRYGYRNWTITDRVTNKTVKADEGRSVTRLIRSYKTRVNGVETQVTITPGNATVVRTCPCCQKGALGQSVLSFFAKNGHKLPEELRAKGPVCYKCQDALGMRAFFSAKAPVATR